MPDHGSEPDAPARLTVAIPTYNRPNHLSDCLASVVAQTCESYQIVIIDNGSTCSYADVLAQFADTPIVYHRIDVNSGASGGFERALTDFCHAEYLTVFHDDDIMHPRMLEWQMAVMDDDPDIVFVAAECMPFRDGQPPPTDVWDSDRPFCAVYDTPADLVREIMERGLLGFSSVMYRNPIPQVDLSIERYGMYSDRPLLLAIAEHGKSALLKAPLMLYRLHAAQDTHSGALRPRHVHRLLKLYGDTLALSSNRGDRGLFIRKATRSLAANYVMLANQYRRAVASSLRRAFDASVSRLRDPRRSDHDDPDGGGRGSRPTP